MLPALMLAPCFPMTRAPAVARTIIRQGGTMAGMLPPSVPVVPGTSTSGWEPPCSASAIPLQASLTSLEAEPKRHGDLWISDWCQERWSYPLFWRPILRVFFPQLDLVISTDFPDCVKQKQQKRRINTALIPIWQIVVVDVFTNSSPECTKAASTKLSYLPWQ